MANVTPRLRVTRPGQKQHLFMCCIGIDLRFLLYSCSIWTNFVVLVQLRDNDRQGMKHLIEILWIDLLYRCSKPFYLEVDVCYNWLWIFSKHISVDNQK